MTQPTRSRTAYERVYPLLVERGRRGLIRRIHGDLHLGNIALIEGRPVLLEMITREEPVFPDSNRVIKEATICQIRATYSLGL